VARSERILDDPCSLSARWTLDPSLARMLVQLEELARREFSSEGLRWPGLFIISGYRSPSLQALVNPNAPGSLHTRCPSLAADLRVGDLAARATPSPVWELLGGIWMSLGGQWGGLFEPDPDSVWYPLADLNHFDLRNVA
jgi:hypothetical protein